MRTRDKKPTAAEDCKEIFCPYVTRMRSHAVNSWLARRQSA